MARLMLMAIVALIISVEKKGVASEEAAEEGGQGCPKLTVSSLRIVCEERGKPVDCAEAGPGTIARPAWKTKVVKQSKQSVSKDLKCAFSGQWKTSGISKNGASVGGYESTPNIGLTRISLFAASHETAMAICRQDGAELFAADTPERQNWVRGDLQLRKPTFPFAHTSEDIWMGISNIENREVFKSVRGRSGDEVPKFKERGNKNFQEKQCVLFNFKKDHAWQIPCTHFRGFYCVIPEDRRGEQGHGTPV